MSVLQEVLMSRLARIAFVAIAALSAIAQAEHRKTQSGIDQEHARLGCERSTRRANH